MDEAIAGGAVTLLAAIFYPGFLTITGNVWQKMLGQTQLLPDVASRCQLLVGETSADRQHLATQAPPRLCDKIELDRDAQYSAEN
jgi:hypothetical protein